MDILARGGSARGRRRRPSRRAWVAVAASVTLAACGSEAGPGSPGTTADADPPPEPSGEVSLWLSADRVPPGGTELVGVLVTSGERELTFGVPAEVERWDGDSWELHRRLAMCLDHWHCTATLHGPEEDQAAAAIGLAVAPGQPGPVQRFSTAGLDPGWYRVGQTSVEGVEARGLLEVADDADEPAPLWPTDAPAVSVRPALIPPDGATVTLTPLVPPVDGGLSAEDVAAAVADLGTVAQVQRWDGSDWVGVTEVELREPPEQGFFEVHGDVPPLDPGAYRLVRRGPEGDHTGSFWVDGAM